MGIVNPGTPDTHINFLKNEMNLDVFFEGGTYTGASAIRMSKIFERVITVEKSPIMHARAARNIGKAGVDNIVLLKGDTRDHLKKFLAQNDNILFWLDAHWSGGHTYGEGDECPLIQELKLIFSTKKNYLVLIDDARLFLSSPPRPHNYLEWPTMREVIAAIPADHEMIVYNDVIYLLPRSILNDFRGYLQDEVTQEWKSKRKSLSGILNYVRSTIKLLSFNG